MMNNLNSNPPSDVTRPATATPAKQPHVRGRPLQHVTVLDLSQGISGPAAAALLASQGARVIKVEPPAGDWIRGVGASQEGVSANAIAGNLRKRSLAVDAGQAAGREVLLELSTQCQVVLQNFRPGVAERIGLGYEAVRARNPSVIYCSISGFGPNGPRVGQAGTDSVVQAFTGLAVLNSGPNATPKRIGLLVPDNITALYAAQAISSALVAQALHGEGAHLQLSLIEACAAVQIAPILDATLFPDPNAAVALLAPAGEFHCSDGWLMVACLNQDMFERLCKALDRTDWMQDERFAQLASRKRNLKEINARLAEALAGKSREHWTAVMDQADVLCSAFNNYAEFMVDAQVLAAGLFVEIDQPPYGKVSVPRLPGELMGTSAQALGPAPRCGEHSREILVEFGLSSARIDHLISQGAVVQR